MRTNRYQSTANIFKQTKYSLYEHLMMKTININQNKICT